MRKEQSIEQLLRRTLGKEAAEALLAKIDRLVAKGAKPETIEKAVTAALQAHFVKQVVAATVSGVGPVTPARIRSIQAKVRPVIRPIVARCPDIYMAIHASPGVKQPRPRR